MLYPTHKKFGILWGLLMIPVAVVIGFIPVISLDMRGGDLFLMVMTVYMAMRGALFGARYPDIDSPSSIPAKRHPYIHKIFRATGVKHRGKYSHDYISIGITFGIIYILVKYGGAKILQLVADGHSLVSTLVYLGGFIFIYMVGMDIVEFFQYIAEKRKNRALSAKLHKYQLVLGLLNVLWVSIVLLINGKLDLVGILTFNIDMSAGLEMTTMLIICLKVYVIFTWAGAYSHLFADMITKQGVYFMGMQVTPMRYALKLKKIPFMGEVLVLDDFKTGTKWEDLNNLFVTILIVPVGIFAIMVLIGFDVQSVIDIIKGLG